MLLLKTIMWTLILVLFAISSIMLYMVLSGALVLSTSAYQLATTPKNKIERRSQRRKNRDIVLFFVMLLISNVVMSAAWYAHLKFLTWSYPAVILLSWMIALPEYMLHVTANRKAHAYFSGAQLKTFQSVFTITGFTIFLYFYFDKSLQWNHAVGFFVLICSSMLIFIPEKKDKEGK